MEICAGRWLQTATVSYKTETADCAVVPVAAVAIITIAIISLSISSNMLTATSSFSVGKVGVFTSGTVGVIGV